MSDEKRHTPSVSLKEDEKYYLEKKAEEAGISYTRYMKEVALCKRSQDGAEIGRDKRLNQLRKDLKKIGTNINQIAKVANETGSVNINRLEEARKDFFELKIEVLKELQ